MMNEPWKTEPNYVKWFDEKTGLRCVVARSDLGHLCGYVRLPHGHKLGRSLKNPKKFSIFRKLKVHGGITYSGKLFRMNGGVQRGYWLGFDCAHFTDFVPNLGYAGFNKGGTYRDLTFVKEQVTKLAQQIMEK